MECCVVGNITANSWRVHAPALLLLVLPRKSNMLPDLSASGKEGGKENEKTIGQANIETEKEEKRNTRKFKEIKTRKGRKRRKEEYRKI